MNLNYTPRTFPNYIPGQSPETNPWALLDLVGGQSNYEAPLVVMSSLPESAYTPPRKFPDVDLGALTALPQGGTSPAGVNPSEMPKMDLNELFSVPGTQDRINYVVDASRRSPASVPEAQVPSSWQAPKAPGQADPYAALMGQQEALIRKQMNERKGDINYNAQVKSKLLEGFSPQLDIAPLLAYADKMSGGNSLQAYKRPEDLQSRMAQVQNYANNIEKQRNGLSDDEMNLLRMKLGVQRHKEDMSLKQQMVQDKVAAKNQKPLTADALKNIGFLDAALAHLDTLDKHVGDKASERFKVIGDNDWTNAKRHIRDNFGHLQTGAAISTTEEKDYNNMIPGILDDEKMSPKKLSDLRSTLMIKRNLLTKGSNMEGTTYEKLLSNQGGDGRSPAGETRVINGVTYKKVNGGWEY